MLLPRDYRHYDHQDFKILFEIGSGGSAAVYAAYWKDDATKFAIKKITKPSKEEEIINEIDIIKKVDFHPNIIKFIGFIKNEINYSFVLEYADGGTLGKYLENARTLKPEIQLKFAKEIASAIYCLHNYDIIHRDIHPNNILIHGHTIKLADFGRSCLQELNVDTEGVFGVIPYVDPKFLDPKIPYNLTKKSDIYSMGVIFWQLTSCSSPFNFEKKDHTSITLDILNGLREEPISNTNVKFIRLYQQCWRHEPDERPDASQVILELNNIDNSNSEESENEETKIAEELKNEENEDDFADCHLSNY
ncbi:kinase-like protein [Rhizophagus irregularis]|uniref:Kinase-like protein n=1 Tax=Rhizophagus irregularis TaxID=588596 RepID=A0A2N0PZN6_9GLOM|nr:kinase-like protein [Rhizophagus irregularis]